MESGKVVGPRYHPSLTSTLRNTRGRELLRIVDTAVPNLKHIREFSVVLKALAIDGQWRRAVRLVREMRDIGVEPNIISYNLLLQAMSKDKQVDKALGILAEMRDRCLVPDLTSHNLVIGAVKPREWHRALQHLEDMAAEGVEANWESFVNASMPCEEAFEWAMVLSLFNIVRGGGMKSNSVGYNYALSACVKGKQWEHGLSLIAEMEKHNYDPDFRLKQDTEAQSRGLDKAPPPEPSRRSTPLPDNIWARKQQLRDLREQDKIRQEERRLEKERLHRDGRERDRQERSRQPPQERSTVGEQPRQTKEVHSITDGADDSSSRWQERVPDSPRKDQAKGPGGASSPQVAARGPEHRAEPAKKTGTARDDQHQGPGAAASSQGREQRALPVEASGDALQRVAPEFPNEERTEAREKPRQTRGSDKQASRRKLRDPGSYVLPVFAQHDRSNHAERQALMKIIARVQKASGAQSDEAFEAECAEVTGTVRLYASHTPCISCMACFCQFQRLFPKVKLCVDFDDWRDTRRMVELSRREAEKKRGIHPPNYDCPGLSDMSDEEPVE